MSSQNGKQRIELPMVQGTSFNATPPDEFRELLIWLGEGVDAMEDIPDDATREQVFKLLEGIDLMHRHAIERLVSQAAMLGGPGLMERIAQDSIVSALLEMYDLEEWRKR